MPADIAMASLRTTAPTCVALMLLLAGCASQPALELLNQIPSPPRDATAAATRCGDHPDHALTEIAARLTALQRREQAPIYQLAAAVQTASDDGTGYEQRHPQAAEALKLRD